MAKIMILGATGSLGKHVTEQAVAANHDVSVLVRTPAKLPADVRERVTVHQADIAALPAPQLAALVRNQDALINTAGLVSEGQRFVALIDHVVTSVETLPSSERPMCWFLAGFALLDIGDSSRRAVELPTIKKTYWPHAENFTRLRSSSLDWRLLCPGPMVEEPPVGLDRLRVASDRLPVDTPGAVSWLPDLLLLPFIARRVPEMIVPYADAAALMLSNLQPASTMSRHRIGLALPIGMRGKKARWSARPATAGTV
ncbi:MAG TPA: NAD(P)H-binding protein [Geminicoccaceae bacterium]|nr:NAD(P)H-binding protein [Geminicoccaceae bacterium]